MENISHHFGNEDFKPDFALVVGNPVKIIGWVGEAGKRLNFNKDGFTLCERSGKKDDRVIEI